LRCFRGFLPLAGLAFGTARSQEAPAIDDWTDLAELGRIQVVAVSRRPVPLADAPAAVSVLAANDILRSGAPSIPEALRAVPGLMVGQIDANSWAISSRGFNSEYAGKMLVMIDGRSVYSPVLSLTYWDEQNAMLDDLDRIEVIRGPGSTHWGANAVNGVINIVGKSARETQGTLAYGSGGWPQEIATGARVGGQAGENTYYRVYGLYQQTGAYPLRATGEPGTDRWHFGQGGFRIDHALPDDAQWTWQGDAYSTESEDDDQSARGANTLGRYKRTLSPTSSIETQVYYDYTWRDSALFANTHHTLDLDFQYSLAAGDRHNLLWGLGAHLGHSGYTTIDPQAVSYRDTLTTHLYSAFVEDEIRLVPGRVALTPGCKIEHNGMTGWESQPGLRLSVAASDNQHLWAAVSRAFRTPSEIEYYPALCYPLNTAAGPGFYLPDSTVRAERLLAYEAGYRLQTNDRFTLSLAAYNNDYADVIAAVPDGARLPSGALRVAARNLISGQVYGGELALGYRATDCWRLTAWYSLCRADLSAPPAGMADVLRTEDSIPAHQAHLRSSLDLGRRWKTDLQLRFVDRVQTIPAYVEADARLACELGRGVELALVGQNLLHSKHPEFRKAATYAHASIPRSFYVKLTWRH